LARSFQSGISLALLIARLLAGLLTLLVAGVLIALTLLLVLVITLTLTLLVLALLILTPLLRLALVLLVLAFLVGHAQTSWCTRENSHLERTIRMAILFRKLAVSTKRSGKFATKLWNPHTKMAGFRLPFSFPDVTATSQAALRRSCQESLPSA
jgi:hypothetical protein